MSVIISESCSLGSKVEGSLDKRRLPRSQPFMSSPESSTTCDGSDLLPTVLTGQGKPRTCGFRLSKMDVAVLAGATVSGTAAYQISAGYSLFLPFVVFHFFLFCNVFRIARKPELVWAAVFLLHSFAWSLSGTFNIVLLFGLQSLFTAGVIFRETRQPNYHGVFSRQLNPRIDDYLSGKT